MTGAALAYAVAGRRLGRRALAIGAAAALLPDVDILIGSASDPLLAIEHHRGFTHSCVFVPIGGLAASLPFVLRTDAVSRRAAAVAGMLAYASHAVLDAATTYGTQLFWPFSRTRVGLDIISILDPLFTLIALAGVIAALGTRRRLVMITLAAAVAWLASGFGQRERAAAAQTRIAAARGDRLERGAVFPTFGNTIVWRSIYESNGLLHIDRIRVPWLGGAEAAPVTSVPRASLGATDARILRDFRRFAWFSDGWVARDPADPTLIGDARYSLRDDAYAPVWGIRFHPDGDPPTEWVDRSRTRDVRLGKLWDEIRGRDRRFRVVGRKM